LKTIEEIRTEIGVYNKTLNNYIRIFNLQIFNKIHLETYNVLELRDYHIAKQELIELLNKRGRQLKEFELDYYKWKSPNYIAEKIGINVQLVLKYLNQNKSKIEIPKGNLDLINGTISFVETGKDNIKYTENDEFTLKSEINHFSSYQVFRDIQLENLENLIIKNSK
jgi:hypothetical protein